MNRTFGNRVIPEELFWEFVAATKLEIVEEVSLNQKSWGESENCAFCRQAKESVGETMVTRQVCQACAFSVFEELTTAQWPVPCYCCQLFGMVDDHPQGMIRFLKAVLLELRLARLDALAEKEESQ